MPGERSSDLEISEDMEFQRRTWAVERIGWIVLAALLLAAMLGLFGNGAFSSGTAISDDGSVSVEFDRFWRLQSPTDLRVSVRGTADDAMRARLWLSSRYLDAIDVSRATPQPESVEAGLDRITYEFALAEPNQPFVVTFRIEPQRPWRARGTVGVEGGGEASFNQFIYP